MRKTAIVAVALDAGPLGQICNPRTDGEAQACRDWVNKLTEIGIYVIIPEIADYEVRRELTLLNRTASLERLDNVIDTHNYLPITTAVMRRAAQLWADVRAKGQPTADRHALDGDVILAAQAESLLLPPNAVVVATTNPAHLNRFVPASSWQEIGGLRLLTNGRANCGIRLKNGSSKPEELGTACVAYIGCHFPLVAVRHVQCRFAAVIADINF